MRKQNINRHLNNYISGYTHTPHRNYKPKDRRPNQHAALTFNHVDSTTKRVNKEEKPKSDIAEVMIDYLLNKLPKNIYINFNVLAGYDRTSVEFRYKDSELAKTHKYRILTIKIIDDSVYINAVRHSFDAIIGDDHFTQSLLLADRRVFDQIQNVIRKFYNNML